jgi:hypothetical protein
MNCPNCHQPVAANARFCGSCGKPIAAPQPDPAAAPAATQHPLQPALAAGPAPGTGLPPPGATDFSGSLASGLIARIKNMLLTPKTEWPVVERETTSIGQLYVSFVTPVAAFAAIVSFLHVSVVGIHIPFGGVLREPITSGLMSLALTLVGAFIGLFIVGLVINALAPTFGGVRDLRQALKTAAYAFIPAWVSVVFGLLPSLGTLLQLIAYCYGIYLLYLGLPIVMHGRPEKAAGYTASVVVCTILLGFVLGAVMAVVGHTGGGMFAHLSPESEASKAEQRDEAADTVGNVLGNMLGTDDKGKQDLGSALSKLAAAGDQKAASSEQKSASASPSALSATTDSGSAATAQDSTEKAFGAAGGLVAALGGALGGSHRVNPVDFQVLKGMLPATIPGMERTNATGEAKQGLGMKGSDATGTYQSPDGGKVEITISDASAVSGLMEMAENMPQTTSSESDGGYEKDVNLGGRKVHEKYDARSRHAELQTIVAKRFSVELTGDGVDMSKLESGFGAIDVSKLEAMRDANPQN